MWRYVEVCGLWRCQEIDLLLHRSTTRFFSRCLREGKAKKLKWYYLAALLSSDDDVVTSSGLVDIEI